MFGAAVIGMLAVGAITSLNEVETLVGRPRAVYNPDNKNHEIYSKLYEIYERVYQSLVPEFDAISKLQSELS